jgi:hypothetical protein
LEGRGVLAAPALLLPLFSGVRGRGILGSSYAASCRETRAQPIMLLGLVLRTRSDYDILDKRIKMRWREYIALSYS